MDRFWKKWTVDKPAAFGDWLWDAFVVQLAARLDRLTLREVIAFIPVLILIFAYLHRIPIPPELMLVGDLFAYIDVFAMIFILVMNTVLNSLPRLDFRHRRVTGVRRRDFGGRTKDEDDGYVLVGSFAWA